MHLKINPQAKLPVLNRTNQSPNINTNVNSVTTVTVY